MPVTTNSSTANSFERQTMYKWALPLAGSMFATTGVLNVWNVRNDGSHDGVLNVWKQHRMYSLLNQKADDPRAHLLFVT